MTAASHGADGSGPSRHLVCPAGSARYAPAGDGAGPPPGPSGAPPGGAGLSRWSAVGEHTGAAHTGFGVCELGTGGSVPAHAHSFEESFFVLAGNPVVRTVEGMFRLEPGDYGLVPVGVPHSWHNPGDTVARWADMQAPQPRAGHGGDTYRLPDPEPGPNAPESAGPQRAAGTPHRPFGIPGGHNSGEPQPVDVRDPRTRRFGHIEPANLDPAKQSQDMLAVSASMRTALLVYSGISVKMMVDADLGAQLSTMFMVQYEPDGVAGPHDHPFEETYLLLEGAADVTLDGRRYRLGPGDIAWAGVGCVHSFVNAGSGPVRWLETQAPQPPARHSYRFARDWDYLTSVLGGEHGSQQSGQQSGQHRGQHSGQHGGQHGAAHPGEAGEQRRA